MAKMKGVQKLNKSITAAFADFGITKMQLTTDYGYYASNKSIDYRLTEGHIEDIWFNEFVKERFGLTVKNIFMFSILHEIGHHETIEEIYESDFLYDFCMKEKERIHKKMQKASAKKSKKLEWEYFNLPDEIAATAWAVDYIRHHKKKLETIWENVQNALVEFYALNLDEED